MPRPIPSPVHENGLVFLMSGFRGNDLRALASNTSNSADIQRRVETLLARLASRRCSELVDEWFEQDFKGRTFDEAGAD